MRLLGRSSSVLRKRLVATAIASLVAGTTAFMLPMMRAQAGTCAWPGYENHAQGNTFNDGLQPGAQSDVNTCDGGLPGSQGDNGRWYDQYYYGVTLSCNGCSNSSEQDVKVTGRGWVCGKLKYTYGPADWSTTNSVQSPWYDMGSNSGGVNDTFCGAQHDWSVKVTAWDGETWSTYLNEEHDSCAFECGGP